MKPKRIDLDKILFVGEFLINQYPTTFTSTTIEEKHDASDLRIELKNGRGYGIEVKTVNADFNAASDKLYPYKNDKWLKIVGDINPKYRYWMLNMIDNSDYLGKGLKMIKERSGLVYIFRDGILFFGPTRFEESIAGMGIYYTTQRQQFEKDKMAETPQWKLIINLEAGKWTPCHVPEEFFKQRNYEDFNRANR